MRSLLAVPDGLGRSSRATTGLAPPPTSVYHLPATTEALWGTGQPADPDASFGPSTSWPCTSGSNDPAQTRLLLGDSQDSLATLGSSRPGRPVDRRTCAFPAQPPSLRRFLSTGSARSDSTVLTIASATRRSRDPIWRDRERLRASRSTRWSTGSERIGFDDAPKRFRARKFGSRVSALRARGAVQAQERAAKPLQ